MSFPPVPLGGPVMTPAELFRYRLFLNGIRDPETVADLWRAERERRAAK